MDPIRLPPIYCPYESGINPHVEAAHEHTLTWVTRFRLVQKEAAMRRFLASRFAWLTARAYPRVGLVELEQLNDWAAWLLLFDDQFDEGMTGEPPEHVRSLLSDYLGVLTTGSPPPSSCGPAAAALGDLCRRTFAGVPDAWRRRFTAHFSQHLDAFNWSCWNTAQGRVPLLDEYLEKRRHSGGMTMAIDLIEPAEHITLPASLLMSPEFETLARVTNDVVCWSNDLFSLEKELARGDVHNLVIVLQRDQGLPLQRAADRVGEMLCDAVLLFEQTGRALPACEPEHGRDVQTYLDDLRAWMRGNLDWSISTGRYTQVERTAHGGVASYLESLVQHPSTSVGGE